MGEEMILSKAQLQTAINNINSCLYVGQAPSLVQISAGGAITSRFYSAFGIILLANVPVGMALGEAIGYINDYVEDFSTYQKTKFRDAYTSWLNYMNSGNFVAIKIQPFNYRDLAADVKFTEDIPNVVGYQQASGNWILPY